METQTIVNTTPRRFTKNVKEVNNETKTSTAERLQIAPHSRKNKLRIEAHRGFGRYEPENTLQAFARAIDEGLDGIELDVWLSKDKFPVVIHTGSYEEEGYVKFDDGTNKLIYEMTLKEIRSKKILKGHIIPTFEEVLRLAKGRICVNIEFKGEDLELTDVVAAYVSDFDMLDQVQFSSFNWKFCDAIRNSLKNLEIEATIPFSFLIWEPEVLEADPFTIGQAGDGITIEYNLIETHRELVSKIAEEALRKGFKLKIYFPFSYIEDFEVFRNMEALGVDTAITNEPYLMCQYYQENHNRSE